jgi:L-threonylcarbamoyladenylate synthase
VLADLDGKIAAVIDGGPCQIGLESTVVDLTSKPARLLRPGGISAESLTKILPSLILDESISKQLLSNEAPRSPGMKYKHYAPKTPLFLLEGNVEEAIAIARQEKNMAVLCPLEERTFWLNCANIFPYTPPTLFALLRDLDKSNFSGAFVRLPTQDGLGLAMRNRLMRACGFQTWK